jgi:hypothetical protein
MGAVALDAPAVAGNGVAELLCMADGAEEGKRRREKSEVVVHTWWSQ